MSREMNDGGAAFPLPMGSETTQGTDGMTLRDYFAGQALAGLLATKNYSVYSCDLASEHSYIYADAMIEARGES